MNALDKNIAVARVEALAANLLATAALQAFFLMHPNREEALHGISAFLDDTLNHAGPAKGNPDDEFNTQVRETARFHTHRTLDAIAAMIRNQPPSA